MDRRSATLAASSNPDAWQADGTFDRYIERHNIEYPDQQISSRSATPALWVTDQYEKDLAAWELATRKHLMEFHS
ncbi:MAG: hypothetical protein JWO51_3545 [Rhodospirillales bacterium]|nr:hypothetical protein [Rhodospirillales bacterium]